MLTLRTLGAADLRDARGRPVQAVCAQPRRLALLIYLAAGNGGGVHRRDKLVALFWPESNEERARNSLNQALHYLRRSLGNGAVTSNREEVALAPGSISADMTAFEQALDSGSLHEAVGLYGGDFLDGFHIENSLAFDEWADTERARLRARFRRALEQLAESAEQAGDRAASIEWWTRLIEADPLSGRATRRLAETLVAAGERERAIRTLTAHATRVDQELDTGPDAELTRLLIKLRSQVSVPVASPRPAVLPSAVGYTVETEVSGPAPATPTATRSAPRARYRRLAIVPLVGVLVAVAWLGLRQALPSAGNRAADVDGFPEMRSDRVIVAAFENRTGDADFDMAGYIVSDWVTRGLQQTGLVDVVDPTAALHTAREFATDSAGAPGLNRAIAIARETGAGVVVWGAIYRQRDSLLFQPQITTVSNGRRLVALDPIVVNQADAVSGAERVLSDVAGALAATLDRRLASISAPTNRPPNFEAYREYMLGLDAFVRYSDDALNHFEAASRLDTMFSTPLIWTILVYGSTRRLAQRDSVVRILASRRTRLAPLDRYSLDYFEAQQRNDPSGMQAAASAAAELSPGSEWSHNAARFALIQNRPREALAYIRPIDPEHGWARGYSPYWANLTSALHLLGKHEEELVVARRALRLAPREQDIAYLESQALIALGRVDEAKRSIEEWLGWTQIRNSTGDLLRSMALELRAHGYRHDADEMMRRAMAWFESAAPVRYIALQPGLDTARARLLLRTAYARSLYSLERWEEARVVIQNVLARDSTLDPARLYDGVLAARRGDRVRAERAIAFLDTRNRPYMPARIAAVLGDRDRAIVYLKEQFSGRNGETAAMLVHRDIDWELLRDYRPFREAVRPKD